MNLDVFLNHDSLKPMMKIEEKNNPMVGGLTDEDSVLAKVVAYMERSGWKSRIATWFKWLSIDRNMDKLAVITIWSVISWIWLFELNGQAGTVLDAIHNGFFRIFEPDPLALQCLLVMLFIVNVIRAFIKAHAYIRKKPVVPTLDQIIVSDYVFGFLAKGMRASGFWFFIFIRIPILMGAIILWVLSISLPLIGFWLAIKCIRATSDFLKSHKPVYLLIILTFLFLLLMYGYMVDLSFGRNRVKNVDMIFLSPTYWLIVKIYTVYFIRRLVVLHSKGH